MASDLGVSFVLLEDGFLDFTEKSWIDLLPDEQNQIFALDWIPVGPKHPLEQLADAMTNWDEDDEESLS